MTLPVINEWQLNMQCEAHRTKCRPEVACFLFTAAFALAAGIAIPGTSAAAEIGVTGSGTFKPLSAEQLAALPANLAFSRADLASGTWSFSVRYDDGVPDTDPDPYAGRYAGAIRAYRLVVGSTTVDLPVDHAVIVTSDGGGGFPNRD